MYVCPSILSFYCQYSHYRIVEKVKNLPSLHKKVLCRVNCYEVILMESCQLVMAISALALNIAEGKSSDEIAFISAVLSQLGDTLDTIAAQRELCSPGED